MHQQRIVCFCSEYKHIIRVHLFATSIYGRHMALGYIGISVSISTAKNHSPLVTDQTALSIWRQFRKLANEFARTQLYDLCLAEDI